MRLKKYIVGVFALMFLYGCPSVFEPEFQPADPQICSDYDAGDEAYKKFLCVKSDLKRAYHPLSGFEQAGNKESGNWCKQKYGHNFVLVDSTEGYEEEQYQLLLNQFFDKANVDLIGPYDKISILAIDGRGKQATELEPLMSECKPPSGQNDTMWPHDRYIDDSTTDTRIQGTYKKFISKVDTAGQQFADLGDTTGEYSQLIEQIKELSRNTKLDFGSDYEYRKIIIFSDLMQFSKNINLISSCRDKKKCVSYEDMKKQMNEKLWENLKPTWGTKKPEVFIYYLQCRHDQELDIGLIDIWESYFEELGMKMTYDIETSCEDIRKESTDPEV